MNYEGIKEKLKSFLLEKTISTITVENVREICQRVVEAAKEVADGTNNHLDDWAVECMQMIVNDDTKIQMICDFIKTKLTGNLCESVPDEDYTENANALCYGLNQVGATADVCDGLGVVESIAELVFKIVIPLLIEWLEGKLNAKE